MSNKKNNEKLHENLIRADKEKSADSNSSAANNNFIEKYTKTRGNISSVVTKKKKFPIFLDIIISFILVLLVAALVAGTYYLIIRFDDSYDNATVEYVLLVDSSVLEGLQKGDNIYIDKSGSVIYLGNIIDINNNISVDNPYAATQYVALTVRADVRYRDDEGYNIDDEKIAVGRSIRVRINNNALNGEIVELTVIKNK